MINLFLILFCLIVWPAMFVYYYRTDLYRWWDNRFGPESDTKAEEK